MKASWRDHPVREQERLTGPLIQDGRVDRWSDTVIWAEIRDGEEKLRKNKRARQDAKVLRNAGRTLLSLLNFSFLHSNTRFFTFQRISSQLQMCELSASLVEAAGMPKSGPNG